VVLLAPQTARQIRAEKELKVGGGKGRVDYRCPYQKNWPTAFITKRTGIRGLGYQPQQNRLLEASIFNIYQT
jgi:hypothetical protein